MKRISVGGEFNASEISLGCMRMGAMDKKEAEALVKGALDCGIDFFDHADIYGDGCSEEVFGQVIRENSLRGKMLLQSKCGIRQGFYDLSKSHILKSADGILKRLQTDYLDVLLLHRPDALTEPGEVAEAFYKLLVSGKVRYFGVSNHKPYNIELLKKYVRQPLIINQLQFSITESTMVSGNISANIGGSADGVSRDGGVLDYCRINGITIQPWSPFQYGFFKGSFLDSPEYPGLNKKLRELADKYGVEKETVAVAWILRHPARMQPVIGTTKLHRLQAAVKACDITLTREEWYGLYKAAGHEVP